MIAIRTAEEGDREGLRDVFRRSASSNEGDRPLLTEHPEFLEWDDAAIGQGRTRVAVEGMRVVGFATTAGAGAVVEVEDLFVDPDRMRGGVGRALIEDLMAHVAVQGAARVEVDANPHAVAFYAAVGFAEIGRVALEHGTAVRMGRAVTPPP